VTGDGGRRSGTSTTERADAGVTPATGLLYVELRDLATVIQGKGAPVAASVLFRFGTLVRNAVSARQGTEIRAQGDSYLCICPTVPAALDLAFAILAAARESEPGGQIAVACGVVAASGTRSAGGYVQSARLGTIAPAGTIVVTDQVRNLAGDARDAFRRASDIERASKSRDRLWVTTAAQGNERPVPSRSNRRVLTLVAGASVIVLVAALAGGGLWLTQHGGGGHLPQGPWTIAAQLPLSGVRAPLGATLQNAIQMAVDEANAQGGVAGQQLVFDVQDEGASNTTDLASSSIDAFVADGSVVAVIGPLQSPHGVVDIPVTNSSGLLECSPGNTNPGLTKPRFGALDLRSAFPNRINYVRVAPSDDIQAPAAASFIFHTPTNGIPDAGIRSKSGLGIRHVLVVDDTTDPGRGASDAFETAFTALGGATERRALNPGTTDFGTILAPLDDASGAPWAVYFGGETTGGAPLKEAMVSSGHADVPLVSWDGLFDGSGTDAGSYINTAGPAAANTYVTQASIAPAKADFSHGYQELYGSDPNSYSAAAYACTQIAIDSLDHAAQLGVDAAGLREAVRAYVADPATKFDTALGTVSFDANGDSVAQYVTLYAVDMGANGGAGDWVYLDQQDFGPPS